MQRTYASDPPKETGLAGRVRLVGAHRAVTRARAGDEPVSLVRGTSVVLHGLSLLVVM